MSTDIAFEGPSAVYRATSRNCLWEMCRHEARFLIWQLAQPFLRTVKSNTKSVRHDVDLFVSCAWCSDVMTQIIMRVLATCALLSLLFQPTFSFHQRRPELCLYYHFRSPFNFSLALAVNFHPLANYQQSIYEPWQFLKSVNVYVTTSPRTAQNLLLATQ